MDDKLSIAKEILEQYNQQHLLKFYSSLTDSQKNDLLNQILKIDFKEILHLYDKSKLDVLESTEEIEPLPYCVQSEFPINKLKLFENIGIKAIKSSKVGVITLAGGQGSRLGLAAPKGTLMLETHPSKSLFEILCDYLKYYSLKYKVNIPWYIMTSTNNYFDTINFFEQNNFFGYGRDNITFFTQDNMPIIDLNGKIVLSEIYKVNIASNGNGNMFSALKKANLISSMEQNRLQWLFVGGIDNVLLDPLDPIFIGYTINSKCEVGSKTLFKKDPNNLAWVFARKNHKPSIVDCENFTEELCKITNSEGKFLYRETNMLAHLFSLKAIKQLSNVTLPYHRAFRKNAFVNDEGMKEVPDSSNVYKFEQFVFDAFEYFDNIALLRVDEEKEFAPIKDFNGPYNPEIAAQKYEKIVLKKDYSID